MLLVFCSGDRATARCMSRWIKLHSAMRCEAGNTLVPCKCWPPPTWRTRALSGTRLVTAVYMFLRPSKAQWPCGQPSPAATALMAALQRIWGMSVVKPSVDAKGTAQQPQRLRAARQGVGAVVAHESVDAKGTAPHLQRSWQPCRGMRRQAASVTRPVL